MCQYPARGSTTNLPTCRAAFILTLSRYLQEAMLFFLERIQKLEREAEELTNSFDGETEGVITRSAEKET